MPRFVRVRLHAKIILIQLGIVLVVAGVVAGASVAILGRVVESQYGERVLAIGNAVALMPTIRDAIDRPDAVATIQPVAEAIRRANDLGAIVVADRNRVRLSHPVVERIGEPLSTDNTPALEGTAYVTTEVGTLGRSIRAKVPIYHDGEIVGTVTVLVLVEQMDQLFAAYWRWIALIALAALAGGAATSYLLSNHIKRQILGLEPDEIAALVEQREAMLHGIREGVLAIDRHGTITIANEEARRLLDLPADAVGRPIGEVVPNSTLPDVLRSGQPEQDQTRLAHNGRVIVVNRMPVRLRGQLVGAISTFRDQTEVQRLARELSGTRGHLDALRAQAHEFANKLHTIAGLLELGWTDDAVRLIKSTTSEQQLLIDDLPVRIGDAALAALLVGKASVAAERGVALTITRESRLRDPGDLGAELVTVAGNLIDNALDAVEGRPDRRVEVDVRDEGADVVLTVRDSGPGVPDAVGARVFDEGFTTKGTPGVRGIGLALVKRIVARRGGAIVLRQEDGAVFEARIPRTFAAGPALARVP